jgi:hypothetical protein
VLWIERFETLESTSDTTRSAAGGAKEAVTNNLLDGKEGSPVRVRKRASDNDPA